MPHDMTNAMREIELGMSNYGHEIDQGFEAALRSEPGKVFGRHAGLEFNGRVWFDGEMFVEQPWRLHVPREPILAPTLEALMRAVNDEWGWE